MTIRRSTRRPLTTEEEGVALAGRRLARRRSAACCSCSRAASATASTCCRWSKTCRFPFLTLVTMRGEWGEFNPWQVPMGTATRGGLAGAWTCRCCARSAGDVKPTVEAAAAMAFDGGTPAVVLLVAAPDRRKGVREMSKDSGAARSPRMRSPPAARSQRPRWSSPASALRTYDLAAAGDHDRNFYLWGAMGGARHDGPRPRAGATRRARCSSLTGDGEALMGIGGFATIAAADSRRNLSIVDPRQRRFTAKPAASRRTRRSASISRPSRAARASRN